MEKPRDITLVIFKYQHFLQLSKREIIIFFMIWVRSKSGNHIGRCSNPTDQQGAEARRELSQISNSWVEQIM